MASSSSATAGTRGTAIWVSSGTGGIVGLDSSAAGRAGFSTSSMVPGRAAGRFVFLLRLRGLGGMASSHVFELMLGLIRKDARAVRRRHGGFGTQGHALVNFVCWESMF